MRDAFLLSGSEKAIMQFQIVLGMISKTKTTTHHACNFLKKKLQHRCFLVVNVKYQLTAASENLSGAILNFRRYFIRNILSAFYKIGVLKTSAKFWGNCICWFSFQESPLAWNFIKLKTASRIFFNEFYKTFNNTVFTEHLRATASDI